MTLFEEGVGNLEFLNDLVSQSLRFVPVLVTLAGVFAGLTFLNWSLRRRWKDNPDAQFKFQLIMLAMTFAGFLAVMIALPISDTLRGQLLSLIGILLSAAIALSSTTFIGNVMAGIMLKAIKSVRPGDFLHVADIDGRVTEMDLLHTEIQTEFRDLVTVPNLFLVTQPIKVVRSSGTIVTAEVSLGYDVPRTLVSKVLMGAIEAADLKDGFVHVRVLGDFSVLYRVAGMLEDVKSLISARARLRECMLDALHEAGIEIVSPNFMNTRALKEGTLMIPKHFQAGPEGASVRVEDVAFDKAEQAASVEEIRKQIEVLEADLAKVTSSGEEGIQQTIDKLTRTRDRLIERLKSAEEARKAAELAENTSTSN